MRFIKITISLVLAIFLFSNCRDNFDLYADDRDITIVYGLLDQSDSIHYIKIYKGFQSEENPQLDAQNMENLYYYNDIKVILEEYHNQTLFRTITLDTTTSVARETGIFANPEQLLYYTDAQLDENSTYKIKIENLKSGKIVTGTTPIVGNFKISYPYENAALNLLSKKADVKIQAAKNAHAYQIIYKFKYIEVSKLTGEITKHGVITRDLTQNTLVYNNNNDVDVSRTYVPKDLYTMLNNTLKDDPSVIRYRDGYDCIEIEVWAGEKNYITYLDVNKPTSSIVQDHLEFTNLVCPSDSSFATAYGIFSSRLSKRKVFNINQESEDSLVKGISYRHLGFDYYYNYNNK